ncbi:unnamed protein product [Scheffersomyces stipitis CBS 6054]|uniref:Unnamed protein product n=1 Tax=Scheffersomyces stipitis (strain ATCC 58785 / CBS 6054 / NBRC 10063 / NRRL Y-11545) TaxID=322104 RepID=A3LQH0_PICST|nr:unnamed protein product [Scheffersomyces stipitis CBS 6054]ABN64680.1 unnamed protein product [Scheffersomyces stipitis CBS 6054]KAG2736981.1 hypothetical protein G9P44_001071 [Scheffersomyces stipitis]
MFHKARPTSRSIANTFKRFNSSHHHDTHSSTPKTFEVNVTKVFGIAAVAGAFLVYKNHEKTDKPLVSTQLYNQQANGERETLRNENYLKRYKTSFVKEFIRDKGGIGQRQYRRIADPQPVPTNLIPAHSPFLNEYGAGIKTDKLGPRKERIRVYAPIDTSSS